MSISSALSNADLGPRRLGAARRHDLEQRRQRADRGLRAADDRAVVADARRLRLGRARDRHDDAGREPAPDLERGAAPTPALGATAARSDAYERMMAAIGEAGGDGALSTLATRLETALMSATASPQSTAKLGATRSRRRRASPASLNRVAEENVALRTEADAEIARQVGAVNDALGADRRHQPQDRDAGAAGRRRHRPRRTSAAG